MSAIPQNLQAVRQQIATAAFEVARDARDVTLLAVSKTFGADAVIEAAVAGQRAFGENYLQEALDKIAVLRTTRPDLVLEWNFIGPIQSNKTRAIAEKLEIGSESGREREGQE